MRAALALLLGLAGPACAEVSFVREDGRPVYGHAVLGDTPEWHGLQALRPDGSRAVLMLPPDRIFEDIAPRRAELDGDAGVEIVVVESAFDEGAALAVYELTPEGLRLEARTDPIGRRNRWLAPVGIADLDGDGRIELAHVETPHIGGTLRVWRLEAGALVQVAMLPGVSNHRIGQAHIPGGIADCPGGPVMLMADARWRTGLAVRLLADGTLDAAPVPLAALDALACP